MMASRLKEPVERPLPPVLAILKAMLERDEETSALNAELAGKRRVAPALTGWLGDGQVTVAVVCAAHKPQPRAARQSLPLSLPILRKLLDADVVFAIRGRLGRRDQGEERSFVAGHHAHTLIERDARAFVIPRKSGARRPGRACPPRGPGGSLDARSPAGRQSATGLLAKGRRTTTAVHGAVLVRGSQGVSANS